MLWLPPQPCWQDVLQLSRNAVRAEFELPGPRHLAMVGGVRKVRSGHSAGHRDSSRMGSWTSAQKLELIALVQDHNPCGASDWEVRCPNPDRAKLPSSS